MTSDYTTLKIKKRMYNKFTIHMIKSVPCPDFDMISVVLPAGVLAYE